MAAATLTSKGQITIPISVRRLLGLHVGDQLDFIMGLDGDVHLKPGRVGALEFRGALKNFARKQPVSLDEMDAAIRAGYAGH